MYPPDICESFYVAIELRLNCRKCFVLTASIMATIYVQSGGARHTYDIPLADLSKVTKLDYISQLFNVLGFSIGKVSVALLIYRLQAPSRWRTRLLAGLSVTVVLSTLLSIILYFVQCSPPRALWDPAAGTCWNLKYLNYVNIALSSK